MDDQNRLQELRKFYSRLTKEQLVEADETLDRYARLVWKMLDRIEKDPEASRKLEEELRRKKPRQGTLPGV